MIRESAVTRVMILLGIAGVVAAQEYRWEPGSVLDGTTGNGGRKIVRRVPVDAAPERVQLTFARRAGYVLYACSRDGGWTWDPLEEVRGAIPWGSTYPSIQTDANTTPWVCYWNFDDAHDYNVLGVRNPDLPDGWRTTHIFSGPDVSPGQSASVLSEPCPDQGGSDPEDAPLVYFVASWDYGDRSELWFAASDTMQSTPYYETQLASGPGGFDFQPTIDYTPGDLVHIAYHEPTTDRITYLTWAWFTTREQLRLGNRPTWFSPVPVSDTATEPASSPSIDADGYAIYCAWRAPFGTGNPLGEIYRARRDLVEWPPCWYGTENVSQSEYQESDHPQCHTSTTTSWEEQTEQTPNPWQVRANFLGTIENISREPDLNCRHPHGAVENPVPPGPFVIRLHTLWSEAQEGSIWYRYIHYRLHRYIPSDDALDDYPAYLAVRLGLPEKSPYCIERDGYRDYGNARVDYSGTRLVYELPYLSPARSYLAEFVLCNGEKTPITESFWSEGRRLGRLTLQPGTCDTFRIRVPEAAYRRTRARLEIVREAGPFAVLANTAKLYEVDPLPQNGDNAMSSGESPAGIILSAQPNPFRDNCLLSISRTVPGAVCASVYDASGRLVRRLAAPILTGSGLAIRWDGTDESGVPVLTGAYYLRVLDRARTSCLKLVKR